MMLMILAAALPACSPAQTAANSAAAQDNSAAPDSAKLRTLTVRSGTKTHQFTVEMAVSADEQARGLMFRTSLADDAGMLFPFDRPRIASFWMKNTFISLDIIFVRPNGTIESIAAQTEPYSLDSVVSGEPVTAVLEIAGGRAAQLGIKPGDTVVW
jgi:uncharacterized membrane protein (UPF0127 family)